MATARIGYRRCAVGISAGLGLAMPLAAYVAAQPFDGAGDVIQAGALPFAAGVATGVCLLTVTGHMLDARAERIAAEEAEAASLTSVFSRVEAGSTAVGAGVRAERQAEPAASRGGRFSRQRTPEGVPVITRAIGALDEIDAWAEIDSMLTDGSPFSCDPARSKDMYQIALEELQRTERAAARKAEQATSEPTADQREAEADREAAMASLYGEETSARSHVPVLPMIGAAAEQPVQAEIGNSGSHAVRPGVRMADYSGHESVWACALAILEEDASPAVEPVMSASNVTAVIDIAAGEETSGISAERMAAMAKEGDEARVSMQVDAILEEVTNKVFPKSGHRPAHEYLTVIEGGTASMPPLEAAEA